MIVQNWVSEEQFQRLLSLNRVYGNRQLQQPQVAVAAHIHQISGLRLRQPVSNFDAIQIFTNIKSPNIH